MDTTLNNIVRQFANQLLSSRLPVPAVPNLGPAEISDAATARYRTLIAAAHDAVSLLRRQTAPPSVAEDVVRELDGREQTIRIVKAVPKVPILERETLDMAIRIQAEIYDASRASAEADCVCLHQLKPLTNRSPACGDT